MENKEMDKMKRQTVIFAVETKNGVVNRIGNAYIATLEIRFRVGEVSWLGDKYFNKKEKKCLCN